MERRGYRVSDRIGYNAYWNILGLSCTAICTQTKMLQDDWCQKGIWRASERVQYAKLKFDYSKGVYIRWCYSLARNQMGLITCQLLPFQSLTYVNVELLYSRNILNLLVQHHYLNFALRRCFLKYPSISGFLEIMLLNFSDLELTMDQI